MIRASRNGVHGTGGPLDLPRRRRLLQLHALATNLHQALFPFSDETERN